jgi:hypothetical protein
MAIKHDTIVNLMACKANELGIPNYIGDLVHDGAWLIANCNEHRTFYWLFKGNGCGTWMSRDLGFVQQYLMRPAPRAAFRIDITDVGEWGPVGTITQMEVPNE